MIGKYKIFFFSFFLLMILGACRSVRTIESERLVHDTVTCYQMERDSVYLMDSVYVYVEKIGDTVYSVRNATKYKYMDRVKHDSVYIHRTDTVTVTRCEVKAVKKGLLYANGAIIGFIGALLFIVLFLYWTGR